MAITMKGRTSIRRSTPDMGVDPLTPRKPRSRTINPWMFDDAVKRSGTFTKLEQSYLAILAGVDGVEERRAEAAKSGRFTEAGVIEDTLKYAVTQVAPELRKAQHLVEAAKGELRTKRAKLTLPIDRSDAYGLARSRPEEARRRIVADPASVDPELRLAIIEMPPELSGTYPSDHRRLTDVALRTVHGDERFTEIAELEEAIPILETVLEAGKEEVAREAGVDLSKFDDVARPYVQDIGALWLRKFVEGDREIIKVFTPDASGRSATFQPATPEQIADGVFFADAAAWRRGNAPFQPTEKANGAAA
jgi:hypothetical protein